MIIRYVNSEGAEVILNKEPYKVLMSDLTDYDNVEIESNGKIAGFTKEITERKLNIDIISSSKETTQELCNKLNEVFEKDIYNNVAGKIYINDYYMRCFIKSCKKSKRGNGVIRSYEYTLITDYPFWIKETTYQYLAEPPEAVKYTDLETGIMFPEFPFDFAPVRGEKILENPSFADSNFIMIIYGFAESPQVSIAGHPYRVETTVYEGERLVIDSKKGTVKKIGRLGEVVDCYNARQKDYSVFEKIPAGLNVFQWSGGFGIDITLFDERSEPKCSL
ncbi:putative uncharacterized protein [Lachnospiraceae bacterium CAG:364]|nr:putative uncharacterized protein [Lachnospiraceae bacterium CAG:364]